MNDPTTSRLLGNLEFEECPGDWEKIQPRPLPYPWRQRQVETNGADYTANDLTVICSVLRYGDGKRWLHVSASRRDRKGRPRIPSYADLKVVKSLFIGDHRKALQIFPEQDDHVSDFEVLHLWCCLDGDPLPDFRIAGTI